jgi:hypothetical protein
MAYLTSFYKKICLCYQETSWQSRKVSTLSIAVLIYLSASSLFHFSVIACLSISNAPDQSYDNRCIIQ